MNPIKAITFSGSEKIIRAIFNIGFIAFIARSITPSELGMFAIIWAIFQIFQSFFGSSLVNAYLRSKRSEELTKILFSASILFGLLGLIAFIGLISLIEDFFLFSFKFYGYLMIGFILFMLPINSFLKGILQGKGRFDRIAIVEIAGLVISMLISILLILKGYGIISLCIKYFIESLCTFFGYFFIFKIKPRLSANFQSNEFLDLFNYSLGLSFSRLIGAITANVSTLFIGYLFAFKYVAYFSYSLTLSKIPDNLFRTMITNPSLTYLGKYNGEKLYEKCQIVASAIIFFAMIPAILIAVNGDDILLILMGSDWKEFSSIFQIMGFFAISQVIKGWLTIVYINFMVMNLWNKFNFIEMTLVSLIIFLSYIFSFDIETFVIFFSFSQLIFWIIIYMLSIIRFSHKRLISLEDIFDLKMIIIPFFAVILFIKLDFSSVIFINTLLHFLGITFLSFVLIYFLDRKSIDSLRRFLADIDL